MFSCTWQFNRRLQCYRPTQFSGADVGSENGKNDIYALSCAPPRFDLSLYCHRIVQHCVRNCESTSMQLWKCFTVSPLRSACLATKITMKTKGPQLQRACKPRWLSSEATVRARSEILAIWAALKQLSENKNDAMCLVLLRLMKTKTINVILSFCQDCHFTWQNWAKFFGRDVWTAQMKASVELCINKLSDAAAKSELKAIFESLIVN